MYIPATDELRVFEAKASEAASLLRALANEQRLLILCHLLTAGELSVSALSNELSLSQSALSQHLAKLREEGIITNRRESQSVFYRVADEKAARVLALLRDIYCPDLMTKDFQNEHR
ncbi:ArsR/SmtB family transcription factor [Asticcacaulis tiandongensis]|uniref:ArsR/SmtB family transcription factor n=1 Tax=Asticcacaulis tiandongensis TaxID=2565365 RepID=UPI00112733A2|nr:metalloregulator ArsR/SmtB family transcription factor [Asticcacaulis tiandongensis]